MRPHRWQPTRLSRPWDSPGKNPGVGCHFLLQDMQVKSGSEVAQSCLTLSDPMDCSLPGSSIHGIFQARVLEWGAIAFSDDKPRKHIKKQRLHFANKGPYSQSYVFSSSHVWMWELDHEEGWALKNWCFWTVVLEKTLESPLDCKEIKPVNSKESLLNICWQDWCWSWSSTTLTTWCKEPSYWKRLWCWERLRSGEESNKDEMIGWYHWLTGHEFEQALRDG